MGYRGSAAVGTLLALIVLATSALAQSGGGFDLSRFVAAGGGGTSVGGPYSMSGTAGQAAAGPAIGGSYSWVGGFWAQDAPTPTPTRTATPIPTSSSTATPAATGTATRTPTITPTPYPRPNVGVQVQPTGTTGRLQVTVTARDAGCNPNNQLSSLHFTSTANGTVDVDNVTGRTGDFTVQVSPPAPTMTFFVNRAVSGQATTVTLVVTDGCGGWSTFVGGGPNAF